MCCRVEPAHEDVNKQRHNVEVLCEDLSLVYKLKNSPQLINNPTNIESGLANHASSGERMVRARDFDLSATTSSQRYTSHGSKKARLPNLQ